MRRRKPACSESDARFIQSSAARFTSARHPRRISAPARARYSAMRGVDNALETLDELISQTSRRRPLAARCRPSRRHASAAHRAARWRRCTRSRGRAVRGRCVGAGKRGGPACQPVPRVRCVIVRRVRDGWRRRTRGRCVLPRRGCRAPAGRCPRPPRRDRKGVGRGFDSLRRKPLPTFSITRHISANCSASISPKIGPTSTLVKKSPARPVFWAARA